ncbi:MAG TPA: PHB depolymerase family esterase [Acidimicrobiales bacterium]|nr:PHB depolymerase family esterase [Acidimicrobiales bacterium]
MGSKRRYRRALSGAVALAVVAAGCSGDDEPSGESGEPASGSSGSESAPAAAAPSPSGGCDGPATGQVDGAERTMEVRGVQRQFLVSAPAWDEGDEPPPLVVDFHGLAEGSEVHAEMTQLGPLGVAEGFVTVFPHGTGDPVAWDATPDPEVNDDLAFVAALLDRLERQRCVDTARVYATGLSNGAMMTSTVACTMADRFAAVAPVAGILLPEPCAPARPVPVLTVHGTADPILLFNGGLNTDALDAALGGGDESTTSTTAAADLDGEGYPATVSDWARLNGCEDAWQDERVSDEVIRRTFDCPDDALVEFLIVEGGGHSWPSSEFSRQIEEFVGPTTFDIDGSREVWDFVSQFRLPDPSG